MAENKHVFRRPDTEGVRFLQSQLLKIACELCKNSLTMAYGENILWEMSKKAGLCNKRTSYSFSNKKQMMNNLKKTIEDSVNLTE